MSAALSRPLEPLLSTLTCCEVQLVTPMTRPVTHIEPCLGLRVFFGLLAAITTLSEQFFEFLQLSIPLSIYNWCWC